MLPSSLFTTERLTSKKLQDENVDCGIVTWKDVKCQILSSNVAFLFTIHAGVNLAFSNMLLNELDQNTSSWFASIGAVGTPIGAIACGPLMDTFGRKACNVMIVVPCVGAWLMLASLEQPHQNVWLLYASRLLSGIAAGLSTCNLVYVSETSHKQYRSVFLSLLGVHFAFGILLTTLLKLLFTWKQSAAFLAALFCVAALLVLRLTPESPVWLAVFQADLLAAKKSLLRLNCNAQIFEDEWRSLTANLNDRATSSGATSTSTSTSTSRWFEPATYRPLAALIILILAQQLSGLYPTVYYAYDLFPVLSPKFGHLLKQEAFVMFGAVRFLASLLSCYLSTRVGRKRLLIVSSLGMVLSAGVTVASTAIATAAVVSTSGVTLFWRDLAEHAAVASFILYVGVGAVGVMTVPWTLIVELLPTEKRAVGGALLVSYAYSILFALAKVFPFALRSFGAVAVYSFFAAVSLLIAVFVRVAIPETLNCTLVEIESFYAKRTAQQPPPTEPYSSSTLLERGLTSSADQQDALQIPTTQMSSTKV